MAKSPISPDRVRLRTQATMAFLAALEAMPSGVWFSIADIQILMGACGYSPSHSAVGTLVRSAVAQGAMGQSGRLVCRLGDTAPSPAVVTTTSTTVAKVAAAFVLARSLDRLVEALAGASNVASASRATLAALQQEVG